ncbi:MAG: DUF3842 family protein [Christensenellales bacterium]
MTDTVVAVVDGQGGGLGRAVIERVRQEFPELTIIGLGTNSMAAANMKKGGASAAASGENAVCVNAAKAGIIIGPAAILCADAMLGELTPKMALFIGQSPAQKILIPLNRCGICIAGVVSASLPQLIDEAVVLLKKLLESRG